MACFILLFGNSGRLRRICTTVEEFDTKAKEDAAYLVAGGHNPFSLPAAFESTRSCSVADARRKITRDPRKEVVFPPRIIPVDPM